MSDWLKCCQWLLVGGTGGNSVANVGKKFRRCREELSELYR